MDLLYSFIGFDVNMRKKYFYKLYLRLISYMRGYEKWVCPGKPINSQKNAVNN